MTSNPRNGWAKLSVLAVILAVIIVCFATAGCTKPSIADPRFELPAPPTVLMEPSKNLEPIVEPKKEANPS